MACTGVPLLDFPVTAPDEQRFPWHSQSREALLVLESVQDALTQQGKGSSTVHHPFDELDFRHLTFDLSIIDGKG